MAEQDTEECRCRRADGKWRPVSKWCQRHLREIPMCAECFRTFESTAGISCRQCGHCGVMHRVCSDCYQFPGPRCPGCHGGNGINYPMATCGTCVPTAKVVVCSGCDDYVVRCSDVCLHETHQVHACWHPGCGRRQCAKAADRNSCEICQTTHYCLEHAATDLTRCPMCRQRCCDDCMRTTLGDTCSDACAWRFKCAVFAIAMRDRLPWHVLQQLMVSPSTE